MKKILILIVFLGALFYFLTPNRRERSPCELTGNKMRLEHALTQKDKGLLIYSFGSGSGKCPGKYDMLSLGFKIGGKLTIGKGRQLVVESVNNYLNVINQEKNFPFLYYIPFKASNIEYEIDTDHSFDPDMEFKLGPDNENEISYLALWDNVIKYNIHTENGDIVKVHRETFEEAERIVNEEKINATKG